MNVDGFINSNIAEDQEYIEEKTNRIRLLKI